MGERIAVDPWRHVDVGEEHLNVDAGLQNCQGFRGIRRLDDATAGLQQKVCGDEPDERFIFDQENDGLSFHEYQITQDS